MARSQHTNINILNGYYKFLLSGGLEKKRDKILEGCEGN